MQMVEMRFDVPWGADWENLLPGWGEQQTASLRESPRDKVQPDSLGGPLLQDSQPWHRKRGSGG